MRALVGLTPLEGLGELRRGTADFRVGLGAIRVLLADTTRFGEFVGGVTGIRTVPSDDALPGVVTELIGCRCGEEVRRSPGTFEFFADVSVG